MGDPARVRVGLNTDFGFEDLSLEGFHAQIILEMASQASVTAVFLLLSFYLFRVLFHSRCLLAPLLVVHGVLESNYLPVPRLP